MLEEMQVKLATINLGDKGPFDAILKPILSNINIFGIDLVEHGLDQKVIGFFTELVAGKGAVKATLKKYLG